MLMRYFGSLNNMLQQYDDLLPKNRRNTKQYCTVAVCVVAGVAV